MSQLDIDYFIFVFIASCGAIQLAAAYSKLKGLLFLPRIVPNYIFAALAIGGAFGWFFTHDSRNVPGLEGAQLSRGVALAALAAIVFTLIVTSLLKIRVKSRIRNEPGLDALKKMGYLGAIKHSFGIGMRKGNGNSRRKIISLDK